MNYNDTTKVGNWEIGYVMDVGGVDFPGSACLNIPALIQAVGGGIPKDIGHPNPGGGNIKNAEARAMVDAYVTSNYIPATCLTYTGHVNQGGAVLVGFVGGDITKPFILCPDPT